LTVTLNPPVCGRELSAGAEITGGVVIGLVLRASVSTGVGTGVGLGVAAGVGRTVAATGCEVRVEVFLAKSVLGCVRGGVLTTGFLIIMEEPTLCPATSSV
jgi:hypothetical protein